MEDKQNISVCPNFYLHKLREKNFFFLLFMSLRLVQLKQRVKELNIPQAFKSLHINTVVTTDCKRTETQ